MAAALAQLSAAGRADYAVIAFDDELKEIKPLGVDADVEEVVDLVLRLPRAARPTSARCCWPRPRCRTGSPTRPT